MNKRIIKKEKIKNVKDLMDHYFSSYLKSKNFICRFNYNLMGSFFEFFSGPFYDSFGIRFKGVSFPSFLIDFYFKFHFKLF